MFYILYFIFIINDTFSIELNNYLAIINFKLNFTLD